ncbi:hypothetical protein ACFWA9_35525 [Kitasatospora sp. NPDC059973]|uniref:hypothetical protein n=1 Tax=Kitasatospora sp. NPDC059973 TaxID=3347020 RepID=UPI00367A081E
MPVLLLATGGFLVGAGGPHAALPAAPVAPMTSEEVTRLVSGLLPPGSVEVSYAGTPGVAGGNGDVYRTDGTFLFDDGKGASMISCTVDRTELAPGAGAVCMDPFSTLQDSCERTDGPDGSVLVIDKFRDRTDPAQREWRATLAAPDGRRIRIIEHNGRPAAANREEPPLDAEQLRALVTSPAWQRVVDALPARANPPVPPGPSATPTGDPTPSAADVLARLVPLLPPGTTQTAGAGPGPPRGVGHGAVRGICCCHARVAGARSAGHGAGRAGACPRRRRQQSDPGGGCRHCPGERAPAGRDGGVRPC